MSYSVKIFINHKHHHIKLICHVISHLLSGIVVWTQQGVAILVRQILLQCRYVVNHCCYRGVCYWFTVEHFTIVVWSVIIIIIAIVIFFKMWYLHLHSMVW